MEPQPLTAAQRVARLIDELGISPYEFGKQTKLSHQTISNVLTGKNRPSLDTLEAIAARYPDTATWLLTGQGQPRTGRVVQTVEEVPAAAEPAVTYTPTMEVTHRAEPLVSTPAAKEFIARLMAEADELREQLKAERKEHREERRDLIAQNQYAFANMNRSLDMAEAQIAALRLSVASYELKLGLRYPTAEESEQIRQADADAANRPQIKGFTGQRYAELVATECKVFTLPVAEEYALAA